MFDWCATAPIANFFPEDNFPSKNLPQSELKSAIAIHPESPTSKFVGIDGTVYQGKERLVFFTNDTDIFFSPQGSYFIVRQQKKMFQIDGLAKEQLSPVQPTIKMKIVELNTLNAKGVLSTQDYLAARKKILGKSSTKSQNSHKAPPAANRRPPSKQT